MAQLQAHEVMVEHVIEIESEAPRGKNTSYWAKCSCGWRTAFTSTEKSIVVDQMKRHAETVQAASVDLDSGTYV